jgi:hypothetical protein
MTDAVTDDEDADVGACAVVARRRRDTLGRARRMACMRENQGKRG